MELISQKLPEPGFWTDTNFGKERGGIYEPDASADVSADTEPEDKSGEVLPPVELPIYIPSVRHQSRGRAAFAALLIIAAIGAVLGFFLYDGVFSSLSREVLDSYLALRVNGGFFENASASFFGALIWAAAPFFFGFCAVGQPVIVLVPLLRGIGAGMASACFVGAFGSAGVAAAAVLVVPSSVLGILIISYQCRLSLKMSACIFSCLNSKVAERRAREYCPTYISRSVLCGLGCFALGLIDAVITVLCGGMFII